MIVECRVGTPARKKEKDDGNKMVDFVRTLDTKTGDVNDLVLGDSKEGTQESYTSLEDGPKPKKKSESKKETTERFAIGYQGTIGLGTGPYGDQETVGLLLTSNGTLTIFYSHGFVDKRKNGFLLDGSIAAQFLFGYSPVGKFDLSGDGQSNGIAIDPGSGSYATDNKRIHEFHLAGAGPSAGIKISFGNMQTTTTTESINLIDFVSGLLRREF